MCPMMIRTQEDSTTGQSPRARRSSVLPAAALTLCLIGAVAPASAALAPPALPTAHSEAGASSINTSGTGCDSGPLSGGAGIAASCATTTAGSTGKAWASAGNGHISISSLADAASLGTTSSYAQGRSNASFTDWIAISGPANSTGQLQGWLYFNGGLAVSSAGSPLVTTVGQASYGFSAGFFGQNVARSGSLLQATNGVTINQNPQGMSYFINATVSFDGSGWAMGSITMTATTLSEASGRPYQPRSDAPVTAGSATAEAAFGHTLYWGGITSLTVGGVEQSGYTVLSSSGTDYRVSTIPEPGSWAMLAAGLAVVALGKARRKGKAA